MTLPPPAPVYQRVMFALVVLGVLIAVGAIAGTLPVLRRWISDLQASEQKAR